MANKSKTTQQRPSGIKWIRNRLSSARRTVQDEKKGKPIVVFSKEMQKLIDELNAESPLNQEEHRRKGKR